MAVVINEFEVSPAPLPKGEPSGQSAKESSTPSPQMLREVTKAVQAKQRREHRLTAY